MIQWVSVHHRPSRARGFERQSKTASCCAGKNGSCSENGQRWRDGQKCTRKDGCNDASATGQIAQQLEDSQSADRCRRATCSSSDLCREGLWRHAVWSSALESSLSDSQSTAYIAVAAKEMSMELTMTAQFVST